MMGHGAQYAMRPGATERPKSALCYAVVRRQKGLIPLRSTIGGKLSPTVAGFRLVVSMVASLSSVTVIVQINPVRFAALAIPAENQPPLLIDTDRMKPRQIAAQLLEMIAGRHAQVLIGRRIVDHLKLAEQPGLKI